MRRHRTGTGDGDIVAVVLSYHARDSTSIARSARTCSVCIIHLRRCTGDADAELEVEGNEWEKCMREREEWEWDEGRGGLGGVLGGEPSVGLLRRKGKLRPIPMEIGRASCRERV